MTSKSKSKKLSKLSTDWSFKLNIPDEDKGSKEKHYYTGLYQTLFEIIPLFK